MTDNEDKQLLFIINQLSYGEIVIKKENGNIVHIKRTESIKLDKVAEKRNT